MAKRSRSTAHIVDLIAEGTVGPAINNDWEQSMYFQETQLKTSGGIYNFDGAHVVGITGAVGAQEISDFASADKVENTILVGVEVTKAGGAVARSITDTDVDDVVIVFEAPQGLVFVSDKSKWYGVGVDFYVSITPDGGSETIAKYHTMANETTSPYRTSLLVDNLTPNYGAGPWVVKVYRTTDDYVSGKNGSYSDRTDWYSYTEVKRVKMQYRNRAVAATTLVAEDFGDNIPNRAIKVKRLDIQYPNNYTPTLTYPSAYAGTWDGDFVRGECNNPAWVVYDICNNKRFGIGLEEINLDKWKLYEIAQWCDGEVVYNVDVLQPDGTYTNTPITQKRFTANGPITDRQQALVVINHLCSVFRGFPLWQAGLVSFEYDVPDDVSRIATEGNVIGGFIYEGTSSDNQHNAIKITYNNPDMFGKQDSVIIENRDAIRLANNEYNLLELFAPLCTNRNEAILRAKYYLYTDINQTELCKFKGGLEWADCLPGEIIAIQDPYYSGTRLGGRILSATATSITIDQSITIGAGTYSVYIQQNTDNVVIKTLTNGTGSTSTLTWSGAITVPQKGNVWVVSSPTIPIKKFRVLSIKESSNITFDIQCYEYDPNKYSLVETNQYVEAPLPQTFQDALLSPPSNLSAEAMTYTNSDGGGRKYGTALSWTGSTDPRTEYYEVRYRYQDGVWTESYTTVNTGYFIEDLSAGSYDFGVRAKALTSSSKWITALDVNVATQVSGVQPPTHLRIYDTVSGTQWTGKDCHIQWDFTDVAYYGGTTTTGVVAYYKIDVRKADTTLLRSWTSASKYETDFIYTYEMNMEDNAGLPIRNPLFYAYSVDIYDTTSSGYSTLATANPAPDMSSTLPVNTFYPTGTGGYVKVSWALNSDLDMSKYVIYFGETNPPASGVGTVLHPINQAEIFNLSDGITYYSKIVPYDLFGVGTASQVSNGATANFSAIDIEDELRDSITITTDTSYSGTLSGIYDQTYDSGGITISNPDGKYIEYYFKIEQYINLSNLWSANANPRVYIGYSSDAITWTYLKAEADHTLDSTGRLIAATNQADAITNYWQLAAGPNKAEWPNNIIARYVRVYFVNTNSTNIYELQHRRMVLAEDVVTDTLSAIVANAGTINAGMLQSTNYSSSLGFKVDMNAAEMYLGGSSTPVMKFYYDSGNKLDITAAVTFRSGTSGYTNITDAPPASGIYNSYNESNGNFVTFPDFEGTNTFASNIIGGWNFSYNSTKPPSGGVNYAPEWRAMNTNTVWWMENGPLGGVESSKYSYIYTNPISVEPNKRYCFSVYTGAHRCNVFAYFECFDSSNNSLATGSITFNDSAQNGGPTLGGYYRHVSFVNTPATTKYVRCYILKYQTKVGQTSSYIFTCRPMLSQVGANQVTAPSWSAGGTDNRHWAHPSDMTKIDGGDLYVGSQLTLNEGGKAIFGNQNVIIDTVGSHGSIVVAPDGGPTANNYCHLNNDDILFMYWNGSSHQLYNSMTRIEMGTASANTNVTLPGIWKAPPKIIVSPNVLTSYNASYPSQSQSLKVEATNITPTGRTYYFYAKAELNLSAGSVGVGVNRANVSAASDWNTTQTNITAANTRRIVVQCRASAWYQTYEAVYNSYGESSTFAYNQAMYKHANYQVLLYFYLSGYGWSNAPAWQYYSGTTAQMYNTETTFTFDSGTQGYNITAYYFRFIATAYDSKWTNGSYTNIGGSTIPTGYVHNVYDIGYTSDLVGASALAYGSLNWVAIGR